MLLEVPRLLASEDDQGESYRHFVVSQKEYDETRLGHRKIREFLKSRS